MCGGYSKRVCRNKKWEAVEAEVTKENRAYRKEVEKASLNKVSSPNGLKQTTLADYTDKDQTKQ